VPAARTTIIIASASTIVIFFFIFFSSLLICVFVFFYKPSSALSVYDLVDDPGRFSFPLVDRFFLTVGTLWRETSRLHRLGVLIFVPFSLGHKAGRARRYARQGPGRERQREPAS
jgi:hypothetical protein